MTTSEFKAEIQKLGESWHQFKAEHEKGAAASADTLAKINGEMDRLADNVAQIQTALKRPGAGADSGDDGWRGSTEGKAFGAFLRKGESRMEPSELKVLTVSDDTTGGYLAVPDYVREIIKAETVISPIRTIARVRPTRNRSVQVPRRTAQFAAVWVGETEARSETTGLTYGLEELPTHELYALVDISTQDLEDPEFDLENELAMEFAEQFALAEGAAFVNGTAAKQPEGYMTNSNVASDNSGDGDEIKDANGQVDGLIDLQHNLKEGYARNATWVLNRKTLGAVRKLKDGNNQYIWQPGFASGIPNSILGNPYVEATNMPDEGANTFPMAFGDFRRAYLVVDRIAMSILRDPFTQATSGTVRFLARRRVGGQVVLAEAIRKLKCAVA